MLSQEESRSLVAAQAAATADGGEQEEAAERCSGSSSSAQAGLGNRGRCRTGVSSSADSSDAAETGRDAAAALETELSAAAGTRMQKKQQQQGKVRGHKTCVYVHDKMIIGGGEKWLLTMAAALQSPPPSCGVPKQQQQRQVDDTPKKQQQVLQQQQQEDDALKQQHALQQQQQLNEDRRPTRQHHQDEEDQQMQQQPLLLDQQDAQQQQLETGDEPYEVEIYTTYLPKHCCFPEARNGSVKIRVYGTFLPDLLGGRATIFCNFCRIVWLWLAMLFTGRWNCDVIVSDQCPGLNPLFRLFCKKLIYYMHYPTVGGCIWRDLDEKTAAAIARRTASSAADDSAADAATSSPDQSKRVSLLQQLQRCLWKFLYGCYRAVFYAIEHANVTACDLILYNSCNTREVARRVYSRVSKKTAPPSAVLYPAVDTAAVDAFLLRQHIDPLLCSHLNSAALKKLFAAWPVLQRGLPVEENFALSLNRMAPDKNIRLALHSVAYANSKLPPDATPIHLVIAGGVNRDPRCEGELDALVSLAQSFPSFHVDIYKNGELLPAASFCSSARRRQQHKTVSPPFVRQQEQQRGEAETKTKVKTQEQEQQQALSSSSSSAREPQEGTDGEMSGEKDEAEKAEGQEEEIEAENEEEEEQLEARGTPVEEGEEEKKRKRAAVKRSTRILFLPDLDESAKNALLAAAFCLLYTPEEEHFGIGPCEAMAFGCPPVACNSGGPLETIVHNETGLLCEPTASAFGDAMLRLASWQQQQPDLLKEMRRAGMKRARQHFSVEVFNKRLRELMRGIDA